MNKKHTFIKNAITLSVGSFLAKFIGAFYRIPLTDLLGANGIGLYQMVFPIYCILLDFSGVGVPSSLSKIIASNESINYKEENLKLLKSSVLLLSIFGIICTLIMLIFSKSFSIMQGNEEATKAYIALSPAIILVAILSCFRGYFQGYQKMYPTAVTQITEQIIKLAFGLLFVKIFLPDIRLSVAGATFAITLSELVALIEIFIIYKIYNKRNNILGNFDKKEFKNHSKKILKICIPVTVTSIMIPLSQVIDSFLIINLLKRYLSNATSLYGLLSGTAMSVVNLPVSVCYGISVAVIPLISKLSAGKRENKSQKSVIFSIVLTLAFAVPMGVGCFLFADKISVFLFRRLNEDEIIILTKLLKILSLSIVLLSVLQTTNGILIGKNKASFPIVSLGVGILVKTALNVWLLNIEKINILGGAISICACYFVAVFINLLYILIEGKKCKLKVSQLET